MAHTSLLDLLFKADVQTVTLILSPIRISLPTQRAVRTWASTRDLGVGRGRVGMVPMVQRLAVIVRAPNGEVEVEQHSPSSKSVPTSPVSILLVLPAFLPYTLVVITALPLFLALVIIVFFPAILHTLFFLTVALIIVPFSLSCIE